jgi:hypothetical protein
VVGSPTGYPRAANATTTSTAGWPFIGHPREVGGFFAMLCRPQPAHKFRIVLAVAADALEL